MDLLEELKRRTAGSRSSPNAELAALRQDGSGDMDIPSLIAECAAGDAESPHSGYNNTGYSNRYNNEIKSLERDANGTALPRQDSNGLVAEPRALNGRSPHSVQVLTSVAPSREKEIDESHTPDQMAAPSATERRTWGGLPTTDEITYLKAQLFRGRPGKGRSVWTAKLEAHTRPLERINTWKPQVTRFVDFLTLDRFEKSVAQMEGDGGLSAEQASAYRTLLNDARTAAEEQDHRESAYRPRMGHIQIKAPKKGTHRFPGQFALLAWNEKTVPEPVIMVVLGDDAVNVNKAHYLGDSGSNSRAALWASYYDPYDYNSYRKRDRDAD